jgi:hypothetical protein
VRRCSKLQTIRALESQDVFGPELAEVKGVNFSGSGDGRWRANTTTDTTARSCTHLGLPNGYLR